MIAEARLGGPLSSATHGAGVRIVVVAPGTGADMTERPGVHLEMLVGRGHRRDYQ